MVTVLTCKNKLSKVLNEAAIHLEVIALLQFSLVRFKSSFSFHIVEVHVPLNVIRETTKQHDGI
jgi:hypothetical protein